MPWGRYGSSAPEEDDYSNLFGNIFGGGENRFTLSSDPEQEMGNALQEVEKDDEVKKARKQKWMNVVSILPLLAQILTSKTNNELTGALGSIQQVMESRREALAKKKEAESNKSFQKEQLYTEYGLREKGAEKERKSTAEESKKGREFTAGENKLNRDHDIAVHNLDNNFRAISDELSRKHQEKLTRLGIGADLTRAKMDSQKDFMQLMLADGYGTNEAFEITNSVMNGKGLSDLSTSLQAAIRLNSEVKNAKTLSERQSITLDMLKKLSDIRIPIMDETITGYDEEGNPIKQSLIRKDIKGEQTRGLITSEVLQHLNPDYAQSLLGFDKVLPPDEISTSDGKTVAQAGEEKSIKLGKEIAQDPNVSRILNKVGKSGNLANAAQAAQSIYKAAAGDPAIAFGFIDNLSWNESMKEAAKNTIRQLEIQKKQMNQFGINPWNQMR